MARFLCRRTLCLFLLPPPRSTPPAPQILARKDAVDAHTHGPWDPGPDPASAHRTHSAMQPAASAASLSLSLSLCSLSLFSLSFTHTHTHAQYTRPLSSFPLSTIKPGASSQRKVSPHVTRGCDSRFGVLEHTLRPWPSGLRSRDVSSQSSTPTRSHSHSHSHSHVHTQFLPLFSSLNKETKAHPLAHCISTALDLALGNL